MPTFFAQPKTPSLHLNSNLPSMPETQGRAGTIQVKFYIHLLSIVSLFNEINCYDVLWGLNCI